MTLLVAFPETRAVALLREALVAVADVAGMIDCPGVAEPPAKAGSGSNRGMRRAADFNVIISDGRSFSFRRDLQDCAIRMRRNKAH